MKALKLLPCILILACVDRDDGSSDALKTDGELFNLLTSEDPYQNYTPFPHADSVAEGTLNGSNAHRPMVRVTVNAKALESLVDGRFPTGESFQDGSIILKRVSDSTGVVLWAVAVKERNNVFAGGGWLWAEFKPDGQVVYTMLNKGAGCISCHSLEQGLEHDLIRTFERQQP